MMILTFCKNFIPFGFTIWEIFPKYNCYRRVVALLTLFLSSFSKGIYDHMEMHFGKQKDILVDNRTKLSFCRGGMVKYI